jgi:cell division protein FtsL
MKSRTWPSILAYTSARILIFGCAVLLLRLAGAGGVLLLLLALVISALASYILLNRQRQLIADKLNGRLGRVGAKATAKASEFRERLEEGTKAEDEEEAVR